MESKTLQWSGDVDLNDGKLQEQYGAYRRRLELVSSVGLRCRTNTPKELLDVSKELEEDLDFIHTGKSWGALVYTL